MSGTMGVNGSMENHRAAPPTTPEDDGSQSQIDLIELFFRLVEKAKFIILFSLLGAILAGAYTFFVITPSYTATSKLYVMNTGGTAISLSDFQMGTYLASDYKEVFQNWHVHELVLQKLGLPYSYSKLSRMLNVTNPTGTRILYITVTADSALEAKSIADTYAQVAREFIATTMDTREPNLFEEALLPSAPSAPSKVRNIALGFLLGLMASCGWIVVRFVLDDRIRTGEEIARYLDLTTLGMMPQQNVRGTTAKRAKRSKGGTPA